MADSRAKLVPLAFEDHVTSQPHADAGKPGSPAPVWFLIDEGDPRCFYGKAHEPAERRWEVAGLTMAVE